MFRPKFITYQAIDPFDGMKLCSATIPYDPRRAAYGIYSKYYNRIIHAAKVGCGWALEGREPKIRLTVK